MTTILNSSMTVPVRWLARLARSPLLHFLVGGLVLFAVVNGVAGPGSHPDNDRTIVVDREELLEYLQYRSNAFQAEYFEKQLDDMTPTELDLLVADYVSEEALYRESRRLGLDTGDAVVRQRVLERMRFLLEDATTVPERFDDATLDAYLEAHAARYTAEAATTFTHIFFAATRAGTEQARNRAAKLATELNDRHVGFNDAPGYGDPFPYYRNYVDRTTDYIASQFGTEFAAALESLEPDSGKWQGPIESRYGFHLVLLTRRDGARVPELAEIRGRVESDLRRDELATALERAVAELTERYRIVIDPAIDPDA